MDETEEQKDTLQETGQSSSEENQGTSTEKAKTYTEKEFQERVSNALSAAGRTAKDFEFREQSLNEREEAAKAKEIESEARELEEAKLNPEKMQSYQAKQAKKQEQASFAAERAQLKKDRAELEREKAEHTEKIRAAEEITLRDKLWEIAARYDVNPQTLKEGVADLKLTTVEQAEKLAKRLKPTGERLPEGEVEGGERKTTPVSVPTTGGTRTPTLEQRDKQSMDDYAATRKKEDPDRFPL